MSDIRSLINTPGDIHDPTQLTEVWDDDAYQTKGRIPLGGCVVDVGANVGSFTIWAIIQGASRVVAVEPFPENVEQMRLNLARTGFEDVVTIFPVAVGANTGDCALIPGGPPGTAERSTGSHTIPGVGCLTTDLRGILKGLDVVDVLKVDCEGAEYDFFSTATIEDLRKIRYLCMEFHVWREPGSTFIEGIGERTGCMPENAVTNLLTTLSITHNLTIQGATDAGGYIFGELK